MSRVERDEIREERITMEIVVDAYNEEEMAMGWYYYLEDHLSFPFRARCTTKRRISPLKADQEVEVLEMASEDECLQEMFVEVPWEDDTLTVPLAQLEPLDDEDEQTKEAIADWHYSVAQGYEF